MAEIVGVVASGISIGTLTAQITTSLIKLKSYWDQVRDAPEDIRDLIEGLEILAYTLAAAEDDQRLNPISSSIVGPTSMCLNRCKKAAERLKDLADKIRADIEAGNRFRRKWGSTKVVLKKDQIDKYRAELGSTIALMSLSQQLYTT